MAHESFEDEEIALVLNTRFVPVKVDREERPEVDMVYMSVCQAMTGQGGWPLTVLMTPDKKPFFSGTYFPPKSTYKMTGLWEILTGIAELWSGDRSRLLQLCDEILSELKERKPEAAAAQPSWNLVEQGIRELKAVFDGDYGGFGSAPKFPAPHNLLLLLMYYAEFKDDQALAMAEKTLTAMARGGIHDQIGGGFSRYSTDNQWLVPHFEKMLYDNALLALAYLEGHRLTSRSYYRKTAESILAYVGRELTDRQGGFYCGQDADSEGVEGKYYVFSEKELRQIFENEEDRNEFCQRYGITKNGNFEGKNIPNLIRNPGYEQAGGPMDRLCRQVYEYRLKRTPLHTDDKLLTSWNSMMILAYARAGFLLSSPLYTEAARKAQEFTEAHLVDKNGRLLVRHREGESAFPGNLDDYAYYSLALLTLYEVTLDINYLEMAVRRAGQMEDLFWDRKGKGFYFYGNDAPELIDRPKELYDGAIPSGNSAAAHVLLTLSGLTAERRWRELAEQQLGFLAAGVKDYPSAHSFSLMAFVKDLRPKRELVCVSADDAVPKELDIYRLKPENQDVSILFKCPGNEQRLSRIAPFTSEYKIPETGARYYLCENHTCGVSLSNLS